jgi:hypothetical protein
MLRVIIAVALAAVVQFAWGFAFHGPLGGLHATTSRAPDEAAVTQALGDTLPESGTYLLPLCPGCHASEEATKAFHARVAAGPLVQIHYQKAGFSMAQMPVLMGMGFGHVVLTTLLAAFLLRMALPALTGYFSRVLFVFGLGVFAAVGMRLGDAIWFHHHWMFPLGQVAFAAVAWLLAGLVMGAIIRPTDQHARATKPSPSVAA